MKPILYEAFPPLPEKDYGPLSFLDREYLAVFIKGESNNMRRLRRAGAKVVVPWAGVCRHKGFHIDYWPENIEDEKQWLKLQRHQDYIERKEQRKEHAKHILEMGRHIKPPLNGKGELRAKKR
jgi:hypothetical protein